MKSSNMLYKAGVAFSILHTRELQLEKATLSSPKPQKLVKSKHDMKLHKAVGISVKSLYLRT